MPESSNPRVIRSVAVTSSDVVAALEMRKTSSKPAVLRLTPPFSGRMRARLHVEQSDEYTDTPQPIHVHPEQLVEESAPSYPRPSETEDELRTDPDRTYTVEQHHDYHTERVTAWRETVSNSIAETLQLETTAGPHEVVVKTLQRDLDS